MQLRTIRSHIAPMPTACMSLISTPASAIPLHPHQMMPDPAQGIGFECGLASSLSCWVRAYDLTGGSDPSTCPTWQITPKPTPHNCSSCQKAVTYLARHPLSLNRQNAVNRRRLVDTLHIHGFAIFLQTKHSCAIWAMHSLIRQIPLTKGSPYPSTFFR